MACMCGDLYCVWCGPAQGNSRCEVCGAWELDGGCADPERCQEIARQWAEEEERRAYADLRDMWRGGGETE